MRIVMKSLNLVTSSDSDQHIFNFLEYEVFKKKSLGGGANYVDRQKDRVILL